MKTLDTRKLILALLLLLPTGCVQQYMANQPKYKPLQPSTLFADGRASRPVEYDTVSRNYRDDPHLMLGRKPQANPGMANVDPNTPKALAAGTIGGGLLAASVALLEQAPEQPMPMAQPPVTPNKENGQKFVDQFAETFPMPVSKEMLERGQQRYNIFCAVCHGYSGSGDGMIVRRGFTRPPSLVQDNPVAKENYSRGIAYQGLSVLLPDAPVGYYFHVISNGYGAMPEHGTQIPVEDRWAIASYLKALQRSQHYKVSEATDEIKKQLAESEKAHGHGETKKEGGAH